MKILSLAPTANAENETAAASSANAETCASERTYQSARAKCSTAAGCPSARTNQSLPSTHQRHSVAVPTAQAPFRPWFRDGPEHALPEADAASADSDGRADVLERVPELRHRLPSADDHRLSLLIADRLRRRRGAVQRVSRSRDLLQGAGKNYFLLQYQVFFLLVIIPNSRT